MTALMRFERAVDGNSSNRLRGAIGPVESGHDKPSSLLAECTLLSEKLLQQSSTLVF